MISTDGMNSYTENKDLNKEILLWINNRIISLLERYIVQGNHDAWTEKYLCICFPRTFVEDRKDECVQILYDIEIILKDNNVYEEIKLLHKYVLISLIQYYQELYEKAMKLGLQSICDNKMEEIEENSIFYKSELFQEEDEYRLIYRDLIKCQNSQYIKNPKGRAEIEKRIRDFKLSEAKYRVGAEGIISYFDLSFEPVMNNIIGEIVLGPKCKMTTADVEFLLSSWGYNCMGENVYDQRSIYIHHSELSYR